MFSHIATLPAKTFIGKSITTSFANNKTFELWRGFMPQRKEIKHTIGKELYSIEVYPAGFFTNFNPNTEFEKWAAVEVSNLDMIPDAMAALTVTAGEYAVFIHKGPANEGPKTYQYIFQTWLPASDFLVDKRPHFAVMGDKYKNDSADSEEVLWIPVKAK